MNILCYSEAKPGIGFSNFSRTTILIKIIKKPLCLKINF